jgi:hypothetical protein
MFEQLKEMNAELEQLKAKHLEKSKEMFTNVSKLVFDKHPALGSFAWHQYTPYFNDGEECVFSVNKDYVRINGDDGDTNYSDTKVTDWGAKKDPVTGKYPEIDNPNYNAAIAAAQSDVKEFLANIDDSVLRDMFGDHVEITVTRNETQVEEYEHD